MMSIKMKQRIIAGILALLVAGFGISGCGRQDGRSANSNTVIDTTNRPDAIVAGATIFLYEGTIVTTEIEAELIHKFDELDSTMGYVLDINVMDSSGSVVSTIVGDSGVIREHDNSIWEISAKRITRNQRYFSNQAFRCWSISRYEPSFRATCPPPSIRTNLCECPSSLSLLAISSDCE